ncbi:uncharacterized protein LOC116706396 [Etheostoma spectabile]|uniref:uncharacterized protein LOC116706396 n=1 Tax=Etheostoma spectabile TaxID=54343 RepID=UPI0013AF85E4|nr:uncharacterized protein LOC116706396 [Etheostoma spectabile]XP_032399107.1 uncharacterized protein LOC116706396 [Etheostoma spectabile]XP_032399114.1 uncharacterized protein LOC116706396 [Etheostoma spectabile]XP_032399120.1 uncharacterized protein LOC116706396 [Etheostoma spectabile]
MSCKQKRDKITSFLFVVIFCFHTFQISHSLSLGQWEKGLTSYKVQEATATEWERIKHDNDAQQGQVIQAPSLRKSTQRGLPELRPESATFPAEPIPYRSPTLDNHLSWIVGNIRTEPRSSASDSKDGYQADFAGFHGVQGKIMVPSLDSRPHFSEWLATGPVVQCHNSIMSVTASGEGFTHLFVDREGASPISLFQLPPYCGYSMRTSWRDLEMIVSYDACYIKQENGRYVLPLLWRGSPLNISCPVQMSTPVPSYSQSVPSVFCSTYGMAVQIHGQEQDVQILKAIVNGGWAVFVSADCAYRLPSQSGELAFFISYGAPCITINDDLHLHLKLDDQEYILSCPVNPPFLFIPSHPLSPSNSQFPYTPDPVSPAPTSLPFPTQTPSQEQIAQLPDYPHYPYPGFQNSQLHQFFYPGSQPDQPTWPAHIFVPSSPPPPPTTTTTTRPMIFKQSDSPSYPFRQFYPQKPIYFPPLPAKEKFQTSPQEPAASPATRPTDTHAICRYNPYPYYHSLYPPYPPVPQYTETEPTMTTTPPTSTSSTASTTAAPTPQVSYLQCLMGKMVVFLPFAHPDSIQVRDQMKTWLYISRVSPLCWYMLQMAEGSGVLLHSPLPACHSQSRTPKTISLALRFWDLSMAQYKTLDLQCPYETTPETSAPVTPAAYPTSPRTAKSSLSVVPKPKVFCTSHQMNVELPSGPISGIVVEDIKGNQMNLQDAPEHCGYSARQGKEGKIRLSLQLHSRCHMSVQGKMYIITVIYMTVSGGREAQLSCPVVVSGSGQECNLPSEQRLPCRPGSVSQPQCLSMGCCFSKHPPACYYPMDECTIDRHFVFSVPASLTEPPLSPALLVTAGNSACKPQRVTSDYALFKIPMDGCGTRRVTAGKTVIYMVEVINKVQSISLNYGTITRDSPVRLLVECRFLPGSVLSVSYLVKTPTLGPEVQTKGIFGVQLRIAKDAQYSSYYPQYHQPLQMLLGKPLYLEVRLLNAPDPTLVLLVHFCVAYPRSGKVVWQLLYNGCPNPLDPDLQQAVVSDPRSPSPQARRFTISTFQFLPDSELKDPDEEIYFMCSTEICSPKDGPCFEGCFGQ